MLDQIVVGIRGVILRDTLQAVEQVSGADLDKAIDADIANIGAVAIVSITDVAMLLDILTAGTIIPFLAYFDGD